MRAAVDRQHADLVALGARAHRVGVERGALDHGVGRGAEDVKGSIEVTKIIGAHLAEARMLKDDPAQPMAAIDKLTVVSTDGAGALPKQGGPGIFAGGPGAFALRLGGLGAPLGAPAKALGKKAEQLLPGGKAGPGFRGFVAPERV